ncbi:cytochrome P450, partial [Mycena alexandri]
MFASAFFTVFGLLALGIAYKRNLRDMPHDKPHWLTYEAWAEKFGDIVYVEVLGRPMRQVTELLEKRSASYSDRPPMPMANDLMVVHMRYSDRWRKTFHQYFHSRAVPAYYPIQMKATRTLLQKLSINPTCFVEHIRHHAGSVILNVVYGYEMQSENDPYVRLAREAMEGLNQAVHPGTLPLHFLLPKTHIPRLFLSWFPGAGFKRKAKIWAKFNLKNSIRWAGSLAAGTAIPSFAADNLENLRKQSQTPPSSSEEIIKNCAGIAYLGTTFQTVSLMLVWILGLFRRGQEQKLPDFNDRDRSSFPYVNAMLQETLRWGPVTPLAIPHMNVVDDEYNGYYIPAGTTVIGNTQYLYPLFHRTLLRLFAAQFSTIQPCSRSPISSYPSVFFLRTEKNLRFAQRPLLLALVAGMDPATGFILFY